MSKSVFEIRNSWDVLYSRVPSFLDGCNGIFAVSSGVPEILIFSGCSTKKYLGASSMSFLFRMYSASTGTVEFDFFIP